MLLVTGSRKWKNAHLLHATLEELHARYGIVGIIHGAAIGADSMAGAWAQSKGLIEMTVPYAGAFGNRGGSVRNQWMVDIVSLFDAPFCVAFPTPDASGTWDCVQKAKARGLPVRIVKGGVE
jgi:hypothetical protein